MELTADEKRRLQDAWMSADFPSPRALILKNGWDLSRLPTGLTQGRVLNREIPKAED